MWERSLSKVFKSVKKEEIWQRWSDVNTWHEWVPNIESCNLTKPFLSGNSFSLKPKGGPAVTVELLNVKKDQTFTGCTRFFGATLYDIHEMHQDPQGLRVTVTLQVTGPLGFLWRKLVAEKIESNLPFLLNNLVNAASAPKLKNPPLQSKSFKSSHTKSKLQLVTSESQKPTPKSKKAKKKVSATVAKKAKLKLNTPETKKASSVLKAPVAKKSNPKSKNISIKKAKAKSPTSKNAKITSSSSKTKITTAKKVKPKTTKLPKVVSTGKLAGTKKMKSKITSAKTISKTATPKTSKVKEGFNIKKS